MSGTTGRLQDSANKIEETSAISRTMTALEEGEFIELHGRFDEGRDVNIVLLRLAERVTRHGVRKL